MQHTLPTAWWEGIGLQAQLPGYGDTSAEPDFISLVLGSRNRPEEALLTLEDMLPASWASASELTEAAAIKTTAFLYSSSLGRRQLDHHPQPRDSLSSPSTNSC